MRISGKVEYHHRKIGQSDFRANDVLMCTRSGHGLEAGTCYTAHAVAQRPGPSGLETVVTLRAGGQLLEVPNPEDLLCRTIFQVETAADMTLTTHSFANCAEFEAWFAQVRPRRCYGQRHVAVEPTDGLESNE